jgi:hypothetical protein
MITFFGETPVKCFGAVFALALVMVVPMSKGQTQSSGASQTEKNKTPEPEMLGVFCDLDPSTETLKPLPMEKYSTEVFFAFGAAFGGKPTRLVAVQGDTSAFHIPAGRGDVFVIRTSASTAKDIRLYHFNFNEKTPTARVGVVRRFRLSGSVGTESRIAVDIESYGDSSYKMTTESPLDPGEYALMAGRDIFTFSIVAP